MKHKLLAAGLLAAGPLSGPSWAHHSNALFEAGKRVVTTGTVVEWFWANPHCLLSADVKGADGRVTRWVVETQAPPNILPYGWSRQSFKAGDIVTMTARHGRRTADPNTSCRSRRRGGRRTSPTSRRSASRRCRPR